MKRKSSIFKKRGRRAFRSVLLGVLSIAALSFIPSVFAALPPPPPPPSGAPPVPQNLVASSPSATQINLSWDAVTDGWLSGYNIYRCSGASCTPTTKIGTTNATTTTYSDTGLSSGAYVYAVTAYSGFGESAQSTVVSANTQVKTYSIADFTALVVDWLKTGSGFASDVNADNVVNTRDLGIMMSFWSGA
ncbi:MAG: fibronectin type III domain-containing protein [Candidatus Moraniibacteriota bacterium]|nr:MAG: fibronectin type III domain-containing protein [Candidatus Moranbacteria bacterium]